MIKINIIKNNTITNSAAFQTQEEAITWLNREKSNGSFGKDERWVREGVEDISGAIDTREVMIEEESITEYKLPAEYTVEIEDITTQLQTQKESDEARAYLASTDWYIIREMDSGELCPQEIKTARATARTKVIN